MSLYDLFEHTQLVIVPMIDYLPIPSDPPAPDKWDFWFFAKTFGPSLIAAGIAGMALTVALTQRTIAANKYNLDLFDKRYEIYNEIIKLRRKVITGDIVLSSNFKLLVSSHDDAITYFDKMPLLFENINKKMYYDLHKELLECEYIFKETSSVDFVKASILIQDKNTVKDDIELKRLRDEFNYGQTERFNKRNTCFQKYIEKLDHMINIMEEKLVISHKPY